MTTVWAVIAVIATVTAAVKERQRRAAARELELGRAQVERYERLADIGEGALAQAARSLLQLAWVVGVGARNPTAKARDDLTALRRAHEDVLDQRERVAIDNAIAATDLSVRLLDDVAAWVRAGTPEAAPTTVVVREAISDALAELDDDGKVTLDVDPLPDVLVDRTLLASALHDVLDNCVRYRWPKKPVHVRIEGDRVNGDVMIWIRDDGLGVALEDAERLFLPFARGDGSAAMPGIGLGLSRARRAIDASGGSIRFVAHEGRGASIELTLPAA